MKFKIKFSSRKNSDSEIEITVKEAGMVQPFEAHGRKSICALVDRKGWDSAWERLEELGVRVLYRKGRPLVNVEEVRLASQKWFKKQREK
jgi:hypothetical protein